MSDDKDEFDDQQWLSLTQDWQSQPTQAVDSQKLLKTIKRRSAVIWLTSILDVVVVAGAWCFGLWMSFEPEKQMVAVFVLMSALWGSVIVYIEFSMRKGTWTMSEAGNSSILDFSIKRCEVAIKIGHYVTPAMLSFMGIIVLWQMIGYWLTDKMHWELSIGFVLWGAICIVASKQIIKRKTKELAKLKAHKTDEG
jgi:hypothetical protein